MVGTVKRVLVKISEAKLSIARVSKENEVVRVVSGCGQQNVAGYQNVQVRWSCLLEFLD